MKELNRKNANEASQLPIKVLQFGEGNFLRAFVDWMIDGMNKKHSFNAGVAVVQPLENGLIDVLNQQEGLYHHLMQGKEDQVLIDEANLITCVQNGVNPYDNPSAYFELATLKSLELVFSNTTEAGIVFDETDMPSTGEIAKTFPGKLTQFLKYRYDHFHADANAGLRIIPCELIESNGENLKDAILNFISLWNLPDDFKDWLEKHNHFATTLVDRIVPGYPRDEIEPILDRIKYNDKLVVKSESFHLFVIKGSDSIKNAFPADQYGFNVKYVDDITPYRTQKVRILNGSHTSMVPIGLLAGFETVSETINDELIGTFIHDIVFKEIVPTIEIPGEDVKEFARQVINRFKNPFIRHELASISLNSIAKFKVRVLPTLLDYCISRKTTPNGLTLSLACLIHYYASGKFELHDTEEVVGYFTQLREEGLCASELIEKILSNKELWGMDLLTIDSLNENVLEKFNLLQENKITEIVKPISL